MLIDALPALFLMDVQTMTQYAYKGIFEWGPLSEYTSKMLNGLWFTCSIMYNIRCLNKVLKKL